MRHKTDGTRDGKKTGRIAALLLCIALLTTAAGCIGYVFTAKSFPLQPIDDALFRDITFVLNKGHQTKAQKSKGGFEASGAKGTLTTRLFFWEGEVVPPEVSRDGYTLDGWSSEAGQIMPGDAPAPITGDDTLRAQWSLTSYAITYDYGFGEPATSVTLPDSYTILSDVIELPALARYAYTFKGWKIKGKDGTVGTLDPSKLRGDITVKARWKPLGFIKKGALYLGGNYARVPYVYDYGAAAAPSNAAGVWQGDPDVDDGYPVYLIGHNPGVFTIVEESFTIGSRFAVCDDAGDIGVYEVNEVMTVHYRTDKWTPEFEKRAMPAGEHAALQVCRGDDDLADVFLADRIDLQGK